ncbi:unnamed protein product [Echinostoma caproni]|uniref:Thymidine phosphorylase n=1 Tax=Echinostoma caproni TaxID=27848 RepID=A0A183BF41_9TREM|nr:unnamed protein product [Echinostoma caproni]
MLDAVRRGAEKIERVAAKDILIAGFYTPVDRQWALRCFQTASSELAWNPCRMPWPCVPCTAHFKRCCSLGIITGAFHGEFSGQSAGKGANRLSGMRHGCIHAG